MRGRWAIALVAAGAILGCGENDIVADYCAYGAVSESQRQHCVDHVTVEEVDARNTNAAQYAREEIDQCLADAGPFCDDRER